jgi:hypothetical protein
MTARLSVGLSLAALAAIGCLLAAVRPRNDPPPPDAPADAAALVERLRARGLDFRCQSDQQSYPSGAYERLPGGAMLVEESTGAAVYAERDDRAHHRPRGFDGKPAAAVGPWEFFGEADFARRCAAALARSGSD